MQFLCQITMQIYMDEDAHTSSAAIMITLTTHHVFAYLSALYRKWEIERFGKPDINGLMRGKVESILATLELFIVCVVVGYTLNYMSTLDEKEFHEHPLVNYWMIIDCLIMITSILYSYLSQQFMINNEITRNVSSLYFLQRKHIAK